MALELYVTFTSCMSATNKYCRIKILGMSNTDHPANKYALIDDGINPLRCHFDAYKGKMVYRDVRAIFVILS